jgi:regulatory protein
MKSETESAYNALLRALTRRDHTEKELFEKLTRWYSRESVQGAIARAHELALIKDEIFLKNLFAEHLHRRQKGIHAINRVLKEKGLPSADADLELELAKCHSLLLKKYDAATRLTPSERAKAYRFLAYRGFGSDVIKLAINQFEAGTYDENSR